MRNFLYAVSSLALFFGFVWISFEAAAVADTEAAANSAQATKATNARLHELEVGLTALTAAPETMADWSRILKSKAPPNLVSLIYHRIRRDA